MSRRVYVFVGLDSMGAIDEVYSLAEELGIDLHLVVSPRPLGGVIVDGMLARSPEELAGRLLEAYLLGVNMDGLVFACCG